MDKTTCTIAGCVKPAWSRGLCGMHYQRWKKTGSPHRLCLGCGSSLPEKPGQQRYCSEACRPRCQVPDCNRPVRGEAWCHPHAAQIRRASTAAPAGSKGQRAPKPKPIREWAADYVCVVCGVDVKPGSGRRKHCSSRCQVLDSRHRGARPKYRPCVRCGVLIDLMALTPAGQFRRVDVKTCDTCRRARSLRHKVSVSDLVRGTFPICGICGDWVDMDLAYPDPGSPSIDHVVPYAHGGSHDLSNLQLAHLRCNHVKSDRVGLAM